jgi:3-hydroxyisobutyrate dehydrogenase
MALAIEMIATGEAMALGKKMGMDSNVLAKIMNISSSRCWSSEIYNPCPGVVKGVPSGNNYDGGFACELMLKDLGIAFEAA